MKRLASILVALLLAVFLAGYMTACGDETQTMATVSSGTTASTATTPSSATASSETTVSAQTTASVGTYDGEPIKLKIVLEVPPTHAKYAMMEEFGKKVTDLTNGKVTFQLYAAGTLAPPPEIFNAVASGMTDISVGPPGYDPTRFALTSFVGNLLHRLPDAEVGTKLIQEIFWSTAELQAEWKEFKVLWITNQTPHNLVLKERAATTADLKGREIRYPGDLGRLGKSIGVVPVSMPMTETYVALEKGVVQGATSPLVELKVQRFAEIAPYTLQLHSNVGVMVCCMSLKKWESLPKEVQAAIESAAETMGVEEARMWQTADQEGLEFAKSLGHEVVVPTAEAMKGFYDAFYASDVTEATRLEADGRPANAVLTVTREVEAKYNDLLLDPDLFAK